MVKNILKYGGVLLAITVAAAFLLGFVNMITSGRIADLELQQQGEARDAVIGGVAYDSVEELEVDDSGDVKGIWEYRSGGKPVAYVSRCVTRGYGGDVDVMVGFDMECKILGATIVSHSETPGLGSLAGEDKFIGQYKGKTGELKVKKGVASSSDEISAISGATITSNAVTRGINSASAEVEKLIEKYRKAEEVRAAEEAARAAEEAQDAEGVPDGGEGDPETGEPGV